MICCTPEERWHKSQRYKNSETTRKGCAAPPGLVPFFLLRTQRLRAGLISFAPPALVCGTSENNGELWRLVFFECGGGAFAFEDFRTAANFGLDTDYYTAKAAALLPHSKRAKHGTLAE